VPYQLNAPDVQRRHLRSLSQDNHLIDHRIDA
jgi:hypothetical protein